MIKIIGYITDAHVAYPVAIAAAGTFFTILGETQDTCLREDIVQCAHGTEQAEKSFFGKSAGKKKTGNSHAESAEYHLCL